MRVAADTEGDAVIFSDSIYVVKAMNEWRQSWMACGWSRQLVNKALLRQLSDAVDARAPHKTLFVHVSAHSGIEGNEMADQLATRGARTDI